MKSMYTTVTHKNLPKFLYNNNFNFQCQHKNKYKISVYIYTAKIMIIMMQNSNVPTRRQQNQFNCFAENYKTARN